MTFHLSTTTLGGGAAGDGGQRPPQTQTRFWSNPGPTLAQPWPNPGLTLPKPRTPLTRHVHALCMRGAPRSSKET